MSVILLFRRFWGQQDEALADKAIEVTREPVREPIPEPAVLRPVQPKAPPVEAKEEETKKAIAFSSLLEGRLITGTVEGLPTIPYSPLKEILPREPDEPEALEEPEPIIIPDALTDDVIPPDVLMDSFLASQKKRANLMLMLTLLLDD